jgi:rRNA maturation endonuclease Nob1
MSFAACEPCERVFVVATPADCCPNCGRALSPLSHEEGRRRSREILDRPPPPAGPEEVS